jgi:cell division septation protein DedD
MGSIKNPVLAAVLFLVWGGLVYAQNNVQGQLGTEIRSLEARLSLAGITSAERHDVLARLARLRQLSGNIAGAAANWLEAAAADTSDDAALIAGAYCLTAIGEWESAAQAIRPLLASGKRGPAMLQARYLDACLRAWFPSGGDASTLAALAGNPEFIALRPLVYYTLWQTITRNPGIRGAANAEHWKTRLLGEFPQSPEARVIDPQNTGASSSISAVQSPLWLLLPGIVGAIVEPVAPIIIRPAESVQPTPVAPAVSTIVLQTGLFSREANARAHSEALQKAGFAAVVSRKLVNGVEHWAVTVPAGQDSRRTAQDLKNAGFDSFPVNS